MLEPAKYRVTGDVKAAAQPLIRIMLLCAAQGILMLLVTVILTNAPTLTNWVYARLHTLADYIPALWRFETIFTASNRHTEFVGIFAVYVGYLAVHCVFLVLTPLALRREIDFASRGRHAIIGGWGSLVLIFCGLVQYLLFLVGPYILPRSSLVNGDYYGGLYVFCVGLPGCNFVLGILLFARYGKSLSRIQVVST